MKVLMYGWEFPPYISGGLGVACYGIINELANLGAYITFVLPGSLIGQIDSDNVLMLNCDFFEDNKKSAHKETLSKYVQFKNIPALISPYITEKSYAQIIERISGSYEIEPIDFNLLNNLYGHDLLSEVSRYALAAGSIASSVDHDVIHAHDWLTILAGVEAKKISGKPLFFHIHSLETDRCRDNPSKAVFEVEKYGMEQADKVIAVSKYTKQEIINNYGIPENKIAVVYNGIYCTANADEKIDARVRQDITNPTILFVGRLAQQKGPHFFVEMAEKVLSKIPTAQFVIAGKGHLFKELIEKVADLRIGKNVHFTGFLDQEAVKKVYQKADIYVMPSVSEPFGIACLEAILHGIPAIVSKQSGVSEVVSNIYTVDFWDTDQMAKKIIELIQSPDLRRSMLIGAKKEIMELTWEKRARELIALYEEMKG